MKRLRNKFINKLDAELDKSYNGERNLESSSLFIFTKSFLKVLLLIIIFKNIKKTIGGAETSTKLLKTTVIKAPLTAKTTTQKKWKQLDQNSFKFLVV